VLTTAPTPREQWYSFAKQPKEKGIDMLKRYMKALRIMGLIALALTISVVLSQAAITFTVPGTADPWLANGITDNEGTPEAPDTVPGQAPVFGGSVIPGMTLSWAASGQVGHPGDVAGPDGAPGVIIDHLIGANNGIPDVFAEACSLMGVFTGPGFGDIFKMGSIGSVTVPAGATKFYMGTMDGFGWANNNGEFTVELTAVPEPSTILAGALLLLPFGASGIRQLRKNKST
jgi:hypothetical protein